jgi:hypothetical protein
MVNKTFLRQQAEGLVAVANFRAACGQAPGRSSTPPGDIA